MSISAKKRSARRISQFQEEANAKFWRLDISDDGQMWEGEIKRYEDDHTWRIIVFLDDTFPLSAPVFHFDPENMPTHPMIDADGKMLCLWENNWSPSLQRLEIIMISLIATLNI